MVNFKFITIFSWKALSSFLYMSWYFPATCACSRHARLTRVLQTVATPAIRMPVSACTATRARFPPSLNNETWWWLSFHVEFAISNPVCGNIVRFQELNNHFSVKIVVYILGCLGVPIVSPNLCVINIDRVWKLGSEWKSIKVGVKLSYGSHPAPLPLSDRSGLCASLYVIVSVRWNVSPG